jgi:hypothetical protein
MCKTRICACGSMQDQKNLEGGVDTGLLRLDE